MVSTLGQASLALGHSGGCHGPYQVGKGWGMAPKHSELLVVGTRNFIKAFGPIWGGYHQGNITLSAKVRLMGT